MSNAQKNLLELFSENELKISLLYKLYSRKVPSMEDFWENLSGEEVFHSKMIEKLNNSLKKNSKDLFEYNQYSYQIITYVSKFIDEEVKKARNGKISPIEAINCALRLEKSMIERKCFEIFDPKTKKIETIMQKLNRETRRHARMLEKEMRKMR